MIDNFKPIFTTITFEEILREQNRATNAMAMIASLIDLPQKST